VWLPGRRSDRGLRYHKKTYNEYADYEKNLTNVQKRAKWIAEKTAHKKALAAVSCLS